MDQVRWRRQALEEISADHLVATSGSAGRKPEFIEQEDGRFAQVTARFGEAPIHRPWCRTGRQAQASLGRGIEETGPSCGDGV